ncbi:glycosyltransferase [Streptococcus suis]|uniref:glycosyltransferase n=1 Tax=Streptococcus suis TaxID=1307 RepID=UPI002FC873CE
MRVLWVTAQILPLVCDELGLRTNGFGGWVMNMLQQLLRVDDLELGVVMVSSKTSKIMYTTKVGIKCYVAPNIGNKGISEEDRNSIIEMFKPDIIHIEGNEFGIHNSFSQVRCVPVMVSLQGILSGYEQYQYGGLPIADYMFSPSKHNIISSWILYFRKHFLFDKRLSLENETIKNVKYISGRTFWDKAHSYWINPDAVYFSCNRILRPFFYENEWNYDRCKPLSIFVGNGYSPLKGIHNVIDALGLLKKEYPEIKLYVAGENPICKKKLSIKRFGYSNLLRKRIAEAGVENNVFFIGSLDGEKMVDAMINCNVYVLPSLIENSPNTLGEAMILGMPCVSAYTGGASEMAVDEKECLFYRANDSKLLAWQLKRVFDDRLFAERIGINARKHAMVTHDPIRNRDSLIDSYKRILSGREEEM